MEHEKINTMLLCLSRLPKKILARHGAENTTEFVLHELAGKDCFNLKKAAYFVDNPDFKVCKGVAGCTQEDRYASGPDVWCAPDDFSCHMRKSEFNNRVRAAHHPNFTEENVEESVQNIAAELDFKNPGYHRWTLKNGNHGILIFEKSDENLDAVKEHLEHGLSLLGFCPIF